MEDLTIAELFDQAYHSYEQIQSNKLDGTADIYKVLLERLKFAEEKLDELHLFSDNEDLSEVPTNELRYFILYALIGWSYEFRPAIREQRATDVQLAMSYYVKYLELCMHYGLARDIPKVKESDEPSKRIVASQEDRQQKIQKLKAKKLLEQSIAKLRTMSHADDEIRRQLYTEQIRWWIQQSEEELVALQDEKKLLAFTHEQQTEQIVQSKNALPFNGPFTVLPTKDRLYREAVGGPGYPSLPTMTVQEFYDDLMRQQAAQQSTQPTPKLQSTSLSDEQRNEIDDPVYRENVRRMDEFKDDHPRGSGNRYNRS